MAPNAKKAPLQAAGLFWHVIMDTYSAPRARSASFRVPKSSRREKST